MRKFSFFVAGFMLFLGNVCHVQAELIDFESIPDIGTPYEGLVIGTQFQATHGVSFSLEGGGLPVIAQVGYPATAFSPGDTPLEGQGVGQFFLTDDGVIEGNPQPLLVTYDNPTAEASGVILDIDGLPEPPEVYTIEALGASNNVLESLTFTAGDPGTGNQLATPWSFNHVSADIYCIRIVTSRENNMNVGLAFDNFDTGIPALINVSIDIKFGSYPNSINLRSKNGVTPVAVFGGEDFNVIDINPSTIEFAGVSPLKWALEDLPTETNPYYVDPITTPDEPEFIGDGFFDVVFHFDTQALRYDNGGDLDGTSTEATLIGETISGIAIEGTDSVRIIKY